MTRKTQFICPYCFALQEVGKVLFRCGNKRCKDFEDIEMTKYENGDLTRPKFGKITFAVPGRNPLILPTKASCPECGQETRKIICPTCHNHLPESTLKGTDLIISVVGSRDVGKSHFVGVLVNELINRVVPHLDGALTGFDDTWKRYTEVFYRRLYEDLQKLDLTQSSEKNINNGAYKPYIFELSLRKKGMIFGTNLESFTLVFFDTAGEDLDDEDTMSTVNKYICKSAGIIFLLDPTKIPAVANQLPENVVRRAASIDWRQATGSDDIMSRVSNLIRREKKIDATKTIDIPVAAVFSKFDVVAPIVPDGATVLESSPHCSEKGFVATDAFNINSEIYGLLKTWGADSFISQLDINYGKHAYFAASALGLNNNPREDNKIERPRPHRIEDPLLWILKESGVIKGINS